jgi:YgiT-type zinc finger domain-containing protein
MKKCPICEKGKLHEGQIEEEMFGLFLGKFKAEICDQCNESFITEDAMKQIERKAKQMGIWGLAEKLKVVKSGNSLSIRIPAKIAHFLKLNEGKEVVVYPDGKKKMVFELA